MSEGRPQERSTAAGAARDASAGAPGSHPAPADGYQLPDVVLIVREDGTIRFANRPLGGVAAEEVIGTSFFAYVSPEQHETVRACLRGVFAWNQTEGCDLAGLHPGERTAWYQCRFAPNTREGKVATATVIARDITARKQLEETLRRERDDLGRRVEQLEVELAAARLERKTAVRKSERMAGVSQQLGAIVDEAGEAMFLTEGPSGRIVDVNETACRWLQTTREELIDHLPNEVGLEFPLRIPDDGEPQFTDTRNSRRPIVFDNARHRRRDRSSFPVEVSLTRHVLGERHYVLAVVRDIKRREQSQHALHETERAYRTLFDTASDAVFLTARDGTIEDANQAALALFGYERDAFLRTNARDLYAKADDVRRFRDAIRDEGAVTDLDVEFRTRAGTPFRARLWAMPRHTSGGGIRGYQCVARLEAASRPVDRPAAPAAQPATAGGIVLIVDPDRERREVAVDTLGRAGLGVVDAASVDEAVALLQDGPWAVGLVLFDAAAEGAPQAAERFRAMVGGAALVLLTDEKARVPQPAVAAGARVLMRPVHPLALLQVVREELAGGH